MRYFSEEKLFLQVTERAQVFSQDMSEFAEVLRARGDGQRAASLVEICALTIKMIEIVVDRSATNFGEKGLPYSV